MRNIYFDSINLHKRVYTMHVFDEDPNEDADVD